MIVLDANVVVSLLLPEHPAHGSTRSWFERTTDAGRTFAVPSGVLATTLRLVTSPRVFERPVPLAAAVDALQAVVDHPAHVRVEPGDRHLALVRRLGAAADVRGELVPDLVLAALAVEHAAEIASYDRDFARFGDALRWSVPGR